MNKRLNAVKEKFKKLKQNTLYRTILISVLALILVVSATLAWYINNMDLWGVEFNTGNIDFNTYVYSADGVLQAGPVASTDENETQYINAPLMTIENAQKGSTGTAYIVVESTGSIGIQYRIAFDIAGKTEKSIAYLGGYKYNITRVTDKVTFNGGQTMDVSKVSKPDAIENELVIIDRNSVNGTIEDKNGFDVYRIDYTLAHKNEEYTGAGIKIYYNIFATQIGGDFEDKEERGSTFYCSTKEDLDRARVEAYPGDTIKLSSDVVYYGDLVFNKPINLETNDFTLTVNGNLMYDYVLSNSLKIDAGGLGRIVVQCTKEGIGGNFQIKAPISDVTLIGSNASNGDIVVEKNVVISATNSYSSAGVSFNEVKIVDLANSKKTIQLESNTRATVSFGTTIGILQSVVKANNIEIVNNGVIGEINLSNMSLLAQTNSPQIYILNNKDIDNPIKLPTWSVKFEEDVSGKCTGNTRIIQSFSGSLTEVTGNCDFDNSDVEIERQDLLVEQIEEGNDSRLKIYYQDLNGQVTSIQSILENYFNNETTTGYSVNEVIQLEIISVGAKAVTKTDIDYMNSSSMLSLRHLNMQRANMYDSSTDTYNKLPTLAFYQANKYETLVLPQNLTEIGSCAFQNSNIENVITIPSGVTTFGSNWFNGGKYVRFAASVPVAQSSLNMKNVKAIFVDEAYIVSYKSAYSGYADRIYPVSVLDETKTHFVRNTQNDEWEITYLIHGEDPVIGEDITIDGSFLKITSVCDNAYRHNFTGTKVKFADSVENLGASNFYNNKSITEVDLNKVKRVGDSAFADASSLTHVEFGNALETIGANAFINCTGLNEDVVLPETMQKIGAYAFQKSAITSINTGGAYSIDGFAFTNCANLIYAELPSVKVIGEDGNNRIFENCSSLVSVKIPSLTKANGTLMFWNCGSLREIYMAAKDDGISLGNNPFAGCNMTTLKLFVPEEHLEFYQNARPGSIGATMIFPQGEKLGEELVNGFNIGTYIVGPKADDTYSLITSNIDHDGELVIPESFNGKAITGIYDNAFRNQKFNNVTLKLSDNLKTIGKYAFYQMGGLVEVDFGSSLELIGDYAFAQCGNWEQNVILPDSMDSIGGHAFESCKILSINTGGTVSVETYAFQACKSLVYVVMPEVTTIAESGTNLVFWNCEALVSIDMPKVSKVYGVSMFANCPSLREIYMASDDANVTLGTNALAGASAELKLYVPEHLVSFYQGRSIVKNTYQVFPRGEKIGDKAINGFVVGDYVVLDKGDSYTLVTSNLTFEGEVTVPDEYNNKPITEIYPNAFRLQTFTDAKLTFGNNLKVIGDDAFNGATGLKSVVIDQVTAIGNMAFYGSGIQTLNGLKVTSIGNNGFEKCASLESIRLPKIEILNGSGAFANCTSLKYAYFEKVTSLANNTFSGDNALENITFNRVINQGEAIPAAISISASAPCKIYVPYKSLSAYSGTWSGKPVVSFDISATHNGDTYILREDKGRYVLIDYIPGQTAAELVLPDGFTVAEIGNISIYAVQNDAFAAVSNTLKALTLSSTITQLDELALSECAALENVYVSADNRYFTSINGLLYSKDSRMLVRYPVGRSGQMDLSATDYASTVGIGANAFTNATKLTGICFPSSLVMIDGSAFENCSQLTTVEFIGITPPVLMGAGLFDVSVENFEMFVPAANMDVYKNAYNFDEYAPYIVAK